MIDLWRSEEMQLIQLIIPAEASHDTVAALGELGLLQFKDLNPDKSAFQRTYANQVKRTDEMARKLRFFRDQVEKAGIPTASTFPDVRYQLDELEAKLGDLETELIQINTNNDRLQRTHSELVELQLVLEKAGSFFDSARTTASVASTSAGLQAQARSDEMDAPLLESAMPSEPKTVRLGFVAGMIEQDRVAAFERLLFRATRGNMYLRTANVGVVLDPASGTKKEKAVFVVFFAGDRARTKIMKICEAFGANRYPFPEEPNRQRQMHAEVTSRLRELQATIDAGSRHQEAVLHNIASNLESWITQVKREKAIYHTLNKLSIDVTRKCLVAEAWAPAESRTQIQQALQSATDRSSASVGTVFQPLLTRDTPPTFFRTNKFTESFQGVVEAYGVARYREVNPGTFTIVTFPFLFAVMFGDFGHAWLMLAFALYMVFSERSLGKQKLGDIMEMMFGGRYLILMMGIFSLFTGLMYNEFFSMPMTLFGETAYTCPDRHAMNDTDDWRSCPAHLLAKETAGAVMAKPGHPYPFGVDPIWHGTTTELPFLNSLKMKMSIILGVAQMTLGIVLSLFNQLHFRDRLSMWCEFVPQILFMQSMFGYLCLLIFMKWIAWQPYLEQRSMAASVDHVGRPPDLYHVLIYMFLAPGDTTCGMTCKAKNDPPGCNPGCPENNMFPGQGAIQVLLLLILFVSVPWMLLPKPLILRARHMKQKAGGSSSRRGAEYGMLSADADDENLLDGSDHHDSAEAHGHGGGGDHGHGEEFEFGEIMVHQMIHTIEFVLGAVSNTASYLRLWALSLAHSQLSAVFYDKTLMSMLNAEQPNTIAVMIAFFVWFCATMGVLMVMESLSAFMHTLRLHWVEFQNKFYRGDGYAFAPFAFALVDKEHL